MRSSFRPRKSHDSARLATRCGSNFFPIVIPCHRVVASGGIGGFAHTGGDGYYRNVKRWLLKHEGVPYA